MLRLFRFSSRGSTRKIELRELAVKDFYLPWVNKVMKERVEVRRKVNTGQADDKVLRVGTGYPIGFASFDDTVSNRRHYVTLPLTLGLGVKGDVTAEKVGP